MGGIFSKPKTPTAPVEPTPEEAETTARKKQQARAGRIYAQDTLLSTTPQEEKAKLLG